MVGFYNYTVILTYIGLISAMFGVFASFSERPDLGVICLVISGVCDMFDGKIARTMDRTKDEMRFGIQIDSLCDLISFGILPVAIGVANTGYKLSYVIVYCMYVLCAIIRLAYYNVTEETRQDSETGEREYYEGLPVTNIAIIVPLLYILRRVPVIDIWFSVIYGVTIFVVACLFVIKFKIKKHPFRDYIEANAKSFNRIKTRHR